MDLTGSRSLPRILNPDSMEVLNAPLLKTLPVTLKFVMNDSAIAFFSVTQQHRDIKPAGLSYEDDYKGNAVAGMITGGRVEIRFHRHYSDERIRNIWRRVLASPQIAKTVHGRLYYQGREIPV
jgi:hypothetical protein